MSAQPRYTPYHPRWYRERVPIFWWLGRVSYVKFIARELTSVAVAYAGLLLLAQVWALGRGPEASARFAELLAVPAVMALNALALAALLFHTVTWLHLAPKALVLKVAGRQLPDWAIVAGHYAAWVAVSAALVWLPTGGG